MLYNSDIWLDCSICTYGGMGLVCRKVSESEVSSRGQSFFPAALPKELRSLLASFFGVLTSMPSSSMAQLHSSTFSSNWGTASLLCEWDTQEKWIELIIKGFPPMLSPFSNSIIFHTSIFRHGKVT